MRCISASTKTLNSLLRRALPARLEIAVFRTLVRQQYLLRGILSPQDAKAMLVRAADVSRRTGDPTSQYDILWLTADVHVHEGQPADANRVLYQALKIAELLHWPDRMQATIERIASLAGVDADQTVG